MSWRTFWQRVAIGLLIGIGMLLANKARADGTACPSGQTRMWKCESVDALVCSDFIYSSSSAAASASHGAWNPQPSNCYQNKSGPSLISGPTTIATYRSFIQRIAPCSPASIPNDWQVTSTCLPSSGICALPAGTTRRFTKTGTNTPPAAVCFQNCRFTSSTGVGDYWTFLALGGAGDVNFQAESTGLACTAEENGLGDGTDKMPQPPAPTELSNYNTGYKCGTYNGETVCLSGLADGQCAKTPGGQAVCVLAGDERAVDDFTSPQAPDNGTPGTPAEPDYLIRDHSGGGSTGALYDQGTVNGSTHQPGPAEPPDDDGDDDGDGVCEVGEECDQNGGSCPEGETCSSNVEGPGGSAKTFGASAGAFYVAVEGSPLVSALSGVATSFPDGACPDLEFPILGETIGTDLHCVVAAELEPLGLVFLAMWGLAGIFIILRA